MAGDAHLTLYSSRIEGHASGNVVVQGRSTCTMTNTVIARGTWAGIVLQGSSQTSLSKVRVLDLRSAGVLCMDKAVLTADRSEFVDGKGLGLLFAGSSRALGGTAALASPADKVKSTTPPKLAATLAASAEVEAERVKQLGRAHLLGRVPPVASHPSQCERQVV